jgi:predicted XRE-type DNA-binding protein
MKMKGITRGSGNVFSDLGFSPSRAADLNVKAQLARQIYNRIKQLGLTQEKAAGRLGISQPDVSKLMNARYTGYSIDRLLMLLSALQVDVDIVVKPASKRKTRNGMVRVKEATAA